MSRSDDPAMHAGGQRARPNDLEPFELPSRADQNRWGQAPLEGAPQGQPSNRYRDEPGYRQTAGEGEYSQTGQNHHPVPEGHGSGRQSEYAPQFDRYANAYEEERQQSLAGEHGPVPAPTRGAGDVTQPVSAYHVRENEHLEPGHGQGGGEAYHDPQGVYSEQSAVVANDGRYHEQQAAQSQEAYYHPNYGGQEPAPQYNEQPQSRPHYFDEQGAMARDAQNYEAQIMQSYDPAAYDEGLGRTEGLAQQGDDMIARQSPVGDRGGDSLEAFDRFEQASRERQGSAAQATAVAAAASQFGSAAASGSAGGAGDGFGQRSAFQGHDDQRFGSTAEQGYHGFEPAFDAPSEGGGQPAQFGGHKGDYGRDDAGYQLGGEQGGDHYQQQDADFYADGHEAENSGRRIGFGRRGLIVLGALVAAIGVGGALGFAYKYSAGSSGDSAGTSPVVIGSKGPVKDKPSDAGGKTFANQKKVIYDRLTDPKRAEQGGERLVARAEPVQKRTELATKASGLGLRDTAGSGGQANKQVAGVRRVRTVRVNPDGTFSMPAGGGTVATQQTSSRRSSSVVIPGITIDGVTTTAPVTVRAEAPKVVMQKATAPKAITPPKPELVAPRTQAVAVLPKPTAPVAESSGGLAGYVVQVAARRNRIQALGAFADLQQRYNSLLGRRQPDIQEADLGSRGTWYRLRIGPPSSKQAAANLCQELKTSGLKDCLIKAY